MLVSKVQNECTANLNSPSESHSEERGGVSRAYLHLKKNAINLLLWKELFLIMTKFLPCIILCGNENRFLCTFFSTVKALVMDVREYSNCGAICWSKHDSKTEGIKSCVNSFKSKTIYMTLRFKRLGLSELISICDLVLNKYFL